MTYDGKTSAVSGQKQRGYEHELVWEACNALDAEGTKPTYQNVRQKLGGRGSYSYIAEGLKSWTPIQPVPAPELPAELADRVQSFTIAIWQSATAAARHEFSREREQMERRIEELQSAVADYDADVANRDSEIAALQGIAAANQQRLVDQEAQIQLQRGKIEALQSVASHAQARVRGSRAAHKLDLPPVANAGTDDFAS